MVAPAWLPANQAEFEFQAGSYKDGALSVIGFSAEEALSQPFRLEVELVAKPETSIDTAKVIGAPALLTVNLANGSRRCLHGIVSQMSSLGAGAGPERRRYLATVVPLFWKLRHLQRSRVFQNLSIPEIVTKVLDQGGVKQRNALDTGKYKKRIYCVQYRESDFAFVSRLLEEEGIFYWFEHQKDEHRMVLADVPSACKNIEGDSTLVFREPTQMVHAADAVYAISQRRELRPGAVMLRDFNFTNPGLALTAQAEDSDGDTALEVYDYPGEYADAAAGKNYAKVRLEELRWPSEVCKGASSCRRLLPGCTFELDDHPELNGKYLIVSVKHSGRQPQTLAAELVSASGEALGNYHNEFESIPAGVPYRPPRRTPRPLVYGAQTAIVVGPKGEEIYTDEHGRIKVQFHWDREGKNDEKSSCWIRVSQLWAGAGWGGLYLPRIGQEVVVEFLEGDPDQPLVTGSVYNGLQPPPESLPGAKTKSTLKSNSSKGGGGSNELRFEDAAGSEEVFLHAQRDLNINVENDKTQRVGGNEHLHVEKDRSRDITGNQDLSVGGNDQSVVKGNQSLAVTQNRSTTVGGNHTETIGGAQQMKVGGSRKLMVALASGETVGLAKALAVGGAYAITVGGAMNEAVGGLKFEAVGGAKVEVVGGRKSETVGGSRVIKVGGDLSEEVKKNRSIKADKDMAVQVKGNYSQQVEKTYGLKAKEVVIAAVEGCSVTVGGAVMQLQKNGDIVIKGKKVEITASGEVVIKGSKIEQN